MKKSKRVISKSKTYGFNPWVDQIDSISQIMEETGEKAESVVLRKLIDEALASRRKTRLATASIEAPPSQPSDETLQTVQTLLLKLVRQGETSLRIQDVSLALIQDTLAESRADRIASWEARSEQLREAGLTSEEIGRQFEQQTIDAKNFAHSAADQKKEDQNQLIKTLGK